MKQGKLNELAQSLVNEALINAGLLPDPNADLPKKRTPQIELTPEERAGMQEVVIPGILAGKLGITIEDARKLLAGEPVDLPESIKRRGVEPLGWKISNT